MLLAIDPGQNSPGIALFASTERKLIAADRIQALNYKELPTGQRWLEVAKSIVTWFDLVRHPLQPFACDTVVFECPQWYQRGKSKGDPNQLVGIAAVAANVTGILSTRAPLTVKAPTPAEWIGQLSKVCPTCKGKAKKKCAECRGSAWETPRGRRIRSRLSEAEHALVPDQNDAIDAVGIGLFALGRLERVSVFSNGHDGR